MNDFIEVYVDGASLGNPGPSGIAVIVKKDGKVLERYSSFAGVRTNNQAEYIAVLKALDMAKRYGNRVKIYSDSELVVRQLNGKYAVKNKNLRELYRKVKNLEREFSEVKYIHVPRNRNMDADMMAKNSARYGK